jgi:hypothetical protein
VTIVLVSLRNVGHRPQRVAADVLGFQP